MCAKDPPPQAVRYKGSLVNFQKFPTEESGDAHAMAINRNQTRNSSRHFVYLSFCSYSWKVS